MTNIMRGIYTIPPAVYKPDMSLDYDAVARCVRFCLDCGAHGIVVPVYATEYFLLSDDERKRILEVTLREVDGKVPVVAGVSSIFVGQAVDLSRHAVASGAAALLAAPPHLIKLHNDEIFDYYRRINAVSTVPIYIQHMAPPIGTAMPLALMLKMVAELEHVSYIKEESVAAHLVLTDLHKHMLANPNGKLLGVMAGRGARALMEEYDRGICGTMPPSQFTDLVVDIWNLLEAGKRKEAYELHTRCLPAFVFGGTYSVGSYRHILKRRGVIDHAEGRAAGWPVMDEYSFRDLDLIMEGVAPLLRVK